MSDKKDTAKTQEPGKTVIKSLGQTAWMANGDPSAIDVKDGRILRIRPLHYDTKYTREELNFWKVEKDGRAI